MAVPSVSPWGEGSSVLLPSACVGARVEVTHSRDAWDLRLCVVSCPKKKKAVEEIKQCRLWLCGAALLCRCVDVCCCLSEPDGRAVLQHPQSQWEHCWAVPAAAVGLGELPPLGCHCTAACWAALHFVADFDVMQAMKPLG